jgi:glucose-6-phosphate 1-epimerase
MHVQGLNGFSYKDKTRGNGVFVDDAPFITVSSEVDRVYLDGSHGAIGDVVVHDRVSGEAMVVRKSALIKSGTDGSHRAAPADVVVWNPWAERAAAIADLAPGSYKNFVCIEPGTVADYIAVDADNTLLLSQELKLL